MADYRYPQGSPDYEFSGWASLAVIVLIVGGLVYAFGMVLGLFLVAVICWLLARAYIRVARDDTL
jgi:uncharacterized membrane protein YhaH (DUF805 family)